MLDIPVVFTDLFNIENAHMQETSITKNTCIK